MFREIQPFQEINILFDQGGLGDAIAGIPAVNYILTSQQHLFIHLFVQDYFVPIAQNYLQKFANRVKIIPMSVATDNFKPEFITKAYSVNQFKNLSCPMTDHAFYILADKIPEDKSFLDYPVLDLTQVGDVQQKFGLPLAQDYIVVTPAFTSPTREFLPEHVNSLVKLLKKDGHNIVFLGQKQTKAGTAFQSTIIGNVSEEIDFSQGLDLIDKTSILEAAKVLANAKCVVGLDNGLIHLAACSSVPIIAGFTSVDPRHRTPQRNGNFGHSYYPVYLDGSSLSCTGCQSNMTFLKGHDFRNCYYGDYKCVKELTGEMYYAVVKEVLK